MKKTKIIEIINNKVISKSAENLKQLGFHFAKKKITAEIDGKTHVIELEEDFTLFYDEKTEILFLCFDFRLYSVITNYDNWYKKNISEDDFEEGYLQFKFLNFYLKLNESDYAIPEDFHPNSKAGVYTDTNVEAKLNDKNYFEGYFMPFEVIEFTIGKFHEAVFNFVKTEINFEKIVEENQELLKFRSMPIYLKQRQSNYR